MGPFDAFNLTNIMQRSGYTPPQGGNLSIPQFGVIPSPAVAQAPAPMMPSYLGSGNSNFKDFKAETAFANISPKPLAPTYSQAFNPYTTKGTKLNCIG
jgi:hypothetical protein